MRRHKMLFAGRLKLIFALPLIVGLLLTFQNCGGSFQSTPLAPAALSGTVLPQSNLGTVLAAQPGAVFNHDPATDSGNLSLSLTADFSPYTSTVQLNHLLAQHYLANGAVFITTDDAYPSSIADPTQSLVFNPSDPRFQQVNAYYHIDQFVTSLAEAGQFPASDAGISVNTHCQSGSLAQNNAYFNSSTRTVCLGYATLGAKTVWAADDADVIVHEFGHSVSHNQSSTTILSSTPDLQASDEAFSDLWAFSQNQQGAFAKWFGDALNSDGATPSSGQSYSGLRNLLARPTYPDQLVGEMHADSVFLSTAVVEATTGSNQVPNASLRTFLSNSLGKLQNGDGIQDIILGMLDEAPNENISVSALHAAFNERGLIRKDDLTKLSLKSTQPVFVIDNHSLSSLQAKGNCNGALDAGETVFILPNLVNSGSATIGTVGMSLTTTAPSSAVQILPGGNVGYLVKVPASSSASVFLDSLTVGSTQYTKYLGFASFVVSASAGSAGTYSFTLTLSGMDTISGQPNTSTLPFSLTVGSAATATSCANESAVWP